MEDFFDDFEDDFNNDGDFMDDDSFEDTFDEDLEPENSFDDDLESDSNEIAKDEPCDDNLTAREATILGGAMGFAYEEGVEEGRRKRLLKEQYKRRKRKKFSDPD